MRFNHLAGENESQQRQVKLDLHCTATISPNCTNSNLKQLKRVDAFGQGDRFEKPDPGKEDEKHIAQDGGRAHQQRDEHGKPAAVSVIELLCGLLQVQRNLPQVSGGLFWTEYSSVR